MDEKTNYSVEQAKKLANSDAGKKLFALLQQTQGDQLKTAMEDAAANAMVGALGDRWSYYIPADQYQAYKEQMRNAYVGVGITISKAEDGSGMQVVSVVAGGPAEAAGVLPGDIIIRLDGRSIAGMEPADAKVLIQGEVNSLVQLSVLRNGANCLLFIPRKYHRKW